MSYWKRDVSTKKLKKIRDEVKEFERRSLKKIVFTNKRSNELLGDSRSHQKIEDILHGWGAQKEKKLKELEESLRCPFKPNINKRSLKIIKGRRARLSAQSSPAKRRSISNEKQ